ncbi:MAG: hypothetical protein JNL64_11165 [Blastocatellia bacterium]|nr:hypothetical protein [Blastocatellia bacterium]
MPDNDFYPQSMEARRAWHVNFYDQIKNHGFAAKYGLDGTTVDKFNVIADWFNFWVPQRTALDAYSQQVTKYFNTIAGNKVDDMPAQPTYTSAGGFPPEPEVGVEKLTRDTAKFIKNNPIYAPADGEAMGIQGSEPTPFNPADLKPVFVATTRAAFEVGVTFKKQGMSAVRFEYRHKGGNWLPGGVILNSPGSFAISPATPGEPEQIEVRAIFMQGNENIGQWSDIVPVFVGP